MGNLVVVHGIEISELVYRGHRVLTYEMVSNVHGVGVDTIQKSYQRNSRHFIEGEHTFLIEGMELQQLRSLWTLSPSASSIRVFTEQGYYLLVKPMRDDLSWEIQGEMAKAYFRSVHQLLSIEMPVLLTPQDRLTVIKDAHFFLKDAGLSDGWSDMLARESVQEIIVQMGRQTSQTANLLPQHTTTADTFMIEDLRVKFPEISNKKWVEMRMSFGKLARKVIQNVDPHCKPIKTQKPIAGAIREVNCWPSEYKEIVVDAIREEVHGHTDIGWKGLFND